MKFVMMENKEKELNFEVCTYKQYAVGKWIELWSVDIGNILTEKQMKYIVWITVWTYMILYHKLIYKYMYIYEYCYSRFYKCHHWWYADSQMILYMLMVLHVLTIYICFTILPLSLIHDIISNVNWKYFTSQNYCGIYWKVR